MNTASTANATLIAEAGRDLRQTINDLSVSTWGVRVGIVWRLEDTAEALDRALQNAESMTPEEVSQALDLAATIKADALARHQADADQKEARSAAVRAGLVA